VSAKLQCFDGEHGFGRWIMNTLTYEIFDSIEEINSETWDSIPPSGSYILSYDFSVIMEEAEIGCLENYYLIFYRGQKPVHKIALMIFEAKYFRFLPEKLKKLLHKISFPVGGLGTTKVLTVQSLFNVAFSILLDEEFLRGCKHDLIDAVMEVGKKTGAALFLLTDRSVRGFSDDFHVFNYAHNAFMKIRKEWNRFDDYLNSMHRKPRWKIKKKIRDVAEAGFFIKIVGTDGMNPDEMYELHRQNVEKYHNEKELYVVINRKFFYKLKERHPGDMLFFTGYKEGDLLGYLACIKDEAAGSFYLESVGFDYMRVDAPLYFSLFYSAIEYCILNGYRMIDFGFKGLETKLPLGATAERAYLLVKPISSWMRFLFRIAENPYIAKRLVPDRGRIQRNIFKIEKQDSRHGLLEEKPRERVL